MVSVKTNSAICIRIVLAFLEFLSCVQGAAGAETEGLQNIKQSLKEIFKIDESTSAKETPKTSLISLFSAQEKNEQDESISESPMDDNECEMSSSSSKGIKIGRSLVGLFHEFYVGVAKYGYFELVFGEDYRTRRSRAKQIFKKAIKVLHQAGSQTFSMESLADALKLKGNNAMNKASYNKAVELYSFAIALCKDKALYFCNRAAALMKIRKFYEAINDCYVALRLDPRYVKAYYRLGSAYYDQGKYFDAIWEGFIRVLQLEPTNESAMVNLQLAECKLREQLAWMEEQLAFFKSYGVIPRSTYRPARQSTVLVLRGPEEGGNGSRPWELVEEDGDTNDNDTISIGDFIDLFARHTLPPE